MKTPFTKQWNPVSGCTPEFLGCANCTAQRTSKSLAGRFGYSKLNPFDVTQHAGKLQQPLSWKKPQRVEVCSMGDLFNPKVTKEYIASVFAVMAACPQHSFLVSTRSVERAKEWFAWVYAREADGRELFPHDTPSWRIWQMLRSYAGKAGCSLPEHHGGKWPLPNVWLGTSVENQENADIQLPVLNKIPAVGHFVQVSPLINAVDLKANVWKLDWVICSGELGKYARPMHPYWVDWLQEQCGVAKVPFFFTSWGEWGLRSSGKNPDDKGVGVRLSFDGKHSSSDEPAFGVPGCGNGKEDVWLGRVGAKNTRSLLGEPACQEIPARLVCYAGGA